VTPRLGALFTWYSFAIGWAAALSLPLLTGAGVIELATLDRIHAIPVVEYYAGAFLVIFVLSVGMGWAFAALHLRVERLLGFNK
jgi:hypothetical protein